MIAEVVFCVVLVGLLADRARGPGSAPFCDKRFSRRRKSISFESGESPSSIFFFGSYTDVNNVITAVYKCQYLDMGGYVPRSEDLRCQLRTYYSSNMVYRVGALHTVYQTFDTRS